MCLLYFGISDSYGLLYYQDYVPNIALTTVNDFSLRILRHYLHFFLLLSCCDAYKSRPAKTYIRLSKTLF